MARLARAETEGVQISSQNCKESITGGGHNIKNYAIKSIEPDRQAVNIISV